jgi:hypothetical protein
LNEIGFKLTDRHSWIVPQLASFALVCWGWILGSLVDFMGTPGDERLSPLSAHMDEDRALTGKQYESVNGV